MARLRCVKWGAPSCKALREAKEIGWFRTGLSATDLVTLGKLRTPVLPALETLCLEKWSASAGVGQLVEGLGVGAQPAVTYLQLDSVCVGDAGASALAATLDRGALPQLKHLFLRNATIGDAGLVALAPALRRRPALKQLYLGENPFGDEGLAALVAPPPAGAPPQQVYTLGLSDTQITDDGCAYLASRLRSGALPALQFLHLYRTLASRAARDAVYKARPGLDG